MKYKRLTVLSLSITVIALTYSSAYAKKIYPAEVMGRDLIVPGLGWIGHVGISNAYMMDPEDIHRGTTAPYYFELMKSMGI